MSNLFTIPNKDENYQSYMVHVLVLIWTAITILFAFVGLYYFPNLWSRGLTLIVFSLSIALFNLNLNHLGYTRQASWCFTIMLWLYVTIPCYTAGGISSPSIVSQMSVVLTAGILLGARGGFAIGVLTMVADFGLAYIEITGHLPKPTIVFDPIQRWIGAIIPFGTMLALQYYASNHLRSGLLALENEILKREEALEKLRASEERYKAIIAISNTGTWEYHLDTDKIWFSSQYFAMLGIEETEAGIWTETVDKEWMDRLHPEDRENSVKIFNDFLNRDSSGLYENYFRMQHQNGDWVWIWSRAKRLLDKNGNTTNICLGTHIDISERIKAEEKTKQNEKLIKKITSQVPSNTYMFEIEQSGNTPIHFFNKGTGELNHPFNLLEPQEIIPKLMTIIHEDDKLLWVNTMKEAYQSQTKISFQYRLWLNGQVRWCWFRAVPEKTEDGKIFWYGSAQDITSLVDYITAIEQIIFDIGHVLRRPICSMKGMTKLIMDNDFSKEEILDFSKKLHQISEEMDKFIHKLNQVYQEKRQETEFKIDVSSSISKRSSLFK